MDWCHAQLQLPLWLALLLTVSWASRDLDEISYRFTSCGKAGREVPTRCTDYYTETHSPLIRDDLYISKIKSGYSGAQGFRIPRAGLYNITVAGAAGGRGLCNPEVGLGIVQKIQVELSPRYELLVLVGQRGLGPCSIDTPPAVCSFVPTRTDEIEECFNQWFNFANTSEHGPEILANVGGGGGGGASMVWPRLLGEDGDGEVTELPLVISGGGGGSSMVLTYSCTVQDLGLRDYITFDRDDQWIYRVFLSAQSDTYNPRLGHQMEGVRGFRDPSILRQVNAGTGGGWSSVAGAPLGEMDGGLLSDAKGFAGGGIDCATLLEEDFDIPFTGMYGGFGGGGGGCGGGGGGGGYTGGSVLWNGSIVSKKVPGSGGHSYYGAAPPANLNITYFGYIQNDGRDGYVEIVPADCGCAFECVVEEDQFECLCPSDAQLAPDQSDCFREIGLQLSVNVTDLQLGGFYYTILTFNEVFVFSIGVNLTITVPGKKRAARQTSEETCAIVFPVRDSETIFLVSNPVRDSGSANTIAVVTETENEFVVSSEYIQFLNSSVLVARAVLVSTQPCSVEGMRIDVNASIKELTDSEPLDIETVTEFLSTAPNFARSVLQLSTDMPRPSPSPPPTNSTASDNTLVIVLASVIVFLVLLIAFLVIGILAIWKYRKQRMQWLLSTCLQMMHNSNMKGFDSPKL